MDFGTLLFLGFLWFVFNLLRQGGAKRPSSSQAPPLPAPSGTDATQREGNLLEALLRDLNRGLEEAARAKTTERQEREEEPEEEWEETASLEVEPEVVSLETTSARPARVRVDQDDAAEEIEARRIAAAAARSGPRTVADHRAFDAKIRAEPADHTAVARTYTPAQLRNAVVWREILGPPAALKDG